MKTISLFLISVFAFSNLFGQTGYVGGEIKYAHKTSAGVLSPLTLDSVIVQLNQNDLLIQQDTVNKYGSYGLSELAPGTYEIRLICLKKLGGVNKGADAQAVLRHIVHLNGFALTGIWEKAAHVSGKSTIFSVDALMLTQRFAGIISGYPLSDWVFESHTVTVNANQITLQNIYGLCRGDVNGSYYPINSFPTTP